MILWQRRGAGQYYGLGQRQHSYRLVRARGNWVLSQIRHGVWFIQSPAYRTLADGKTAAVHMETRA